MRAPTARRSSPRARRACGLWANRGREWGRPGSPAVVRLLREPRKRLVQARKAGFEASSGELVANIDADTLLPPGWLARVLAEFASDPELVTVSGPYDYYDVPFRIRAAARVFYLVGFGT